MAIDFNDERFQTFLKETLGKPLDSVFHATIPFDLGYEKGGASDVYMYEYKNDYLCYITGDLIGKNQKPSDCGNYELMIIMRKDEQWGAKLIRILAYATLDESYNNEETMDIGLFGNKTNMAAILFSKYAETIIEQEKYSIMLIIGITKAELEWKLKNGGDKLLQLLKDKFVYPTTDLQRDSIVK